MRVDAAGGRMRIAHAATGHTIALLLARTLAALLVAMSVAACGAVAPVRPDNAKAIAPTIVAQGSGPAGEFRVWAYHTSDGMACIEVGSTSGSTAACDPTGAPPVGGGGIGRNAHGVVVSAITSAATATTAVVRDSTGPDVTVALIEVGPIFAGVKVAVANLGTSANPVAIDFLDAVGSKVESVALP